VGYIIHYDICALVIYAITGVVFYFKKRIPCNKNKVFGILVGDSALSTVLDILSVFSTGEWGIGLKIFFHTAYYFTHNLIPFLFVIYILFLTDGYKEMSALFKSFLYTPMIVDLLLVITTPVTHFIIYVDSQGGYHRGTLQPFTYIVAIYYLIFGIVYAMGNRSMLSRQVVTSITAFISMTVVAVIVQMINKLLLVECFAASVCMLLIMFTLQSQDDMIDQGTKMLNWSSFVNRCSIKYASASDFTLLLIRIPDFKMFMKTFGGRFSNSLLRSFSDYLYNFVNLGDGFYLEDECFALMFPKDSEKVGETYRAIRKKLSENWNIGTVDTLITACFMRIDCPEDVDNADMLVDFIEQFKHREPETERLLHATDINFYDSKRRSEVENAIDKALDNRGFEVYYQPIYSSSRNKIVSCEALVRLKDEKLGFIPPQEFIPIAEENGKILKIGKYVFEEACRFIKKGVGTSLGIEYVQVNLSVVQCMQSDLVEQLLSIMDRYKVDPSSICLEVTETAAVYTPHIMEKNIKTLSDYGVKFALDDYGSGNANCSYLIRFPFQEIKIDKEIVWASFHDKAARIVLENEIHTIKQLGIPLIIEGIEEREQSEAMEQLGVECIQGYYYGRPLPEQECLRYIRTFQEKAQNDRQQAAVPGEKQREAGR